MDNLIIYEKDRFYISNKLDIVRCTKSDDKLVIFEYTDKSTLGFYKDSTGLIKELPVELTIGDEEDDEEYDEEREYANFQFITESLDIVLSKSSNFSEKEEDYILREEQILVGLDAKNSRYIAKTIKDEKEIVLILNIRSELIKKLVNKKKQLIKILQR